MLPKGIQVILAEKTCCTGRKEVILAWERKVLMKKSPGRKKSCWQKKSYMWEEKKVLLAKEMYHWRNNSMYNGPSEGPKAQFFHTLSTVSRPN